MGQTQTSFGESNPFDLTGHFAVITGASKGIGRAIALRLAEAGAEVGLIARNEDALNEIARTIRRRGGTAYVEGCDVCDLGDLKTRLERLPIPDIFVNNAGMNIPQSFLDVDTGSFDATFALNVRAAFFAAQAAARRILDADRRGVIINISSQAGHVGLRKRTVYCASKHALEGLTKTMALELAPDIRVVSIAPTFVVTPMTRPFLEDPTFRKYVESHLLVKEVGTVEDVAHAVLYASSPAAKLMTGASLILDGGWTAH